MPEPRRLGDRAPHEALLDVKALEVSYGAIKALKGVALSVGKGEAVALIGANGAGKTSTLRAISGHDQAAGGRHHPARRERHRPQVAPDGAPGHGPRARRARACSPTSP